MRVDYDEIALSEQYQKTLQEWVKLQPKISTEQLVDLLKARYTLSYARAWEQVSAWRMAERLLKEAQRVD